MMELKNCEKLSLIEMEQMNTGLKGSDLQNTIIIKYKVKRKEVSVVKEEIKQYRLRLRLQK